MNSSLIFKFLSDNVFLVGVAVVSGGMLLWPYLRRTGGAQVDIQQATLLINREDAVIVDVREPDEFAKGHILHARNLPLSQLEARAGDLQRYKAKPLIVACQTGSRAGSAVSALRKKGFERVFALAGGVSGWQQAGLPVEK